VLGHGSYHDPTADGARIEYTLMTRMPGKAMWHVSLDASARRGVLRQVGATLRRIHALPQAPLRESELLPGDHTFVDVQIRFGRYFTDLADAVRCEQVPWTFEVSPEQVGARALTALPSSRERVALHSNPYLEHVFVDPESGAYSGLIDFGDAYISHPACDLRRWTRPADREALLEGYTADEPVNEAFLATWRVLGIFTTAQVMAHYGDEAPARAEEARDSLRALLAELS
jgi:aminoglycoside phosphotransferase (APT) family kinase protein